MCKCLQYCLETCYWHLIEKRFCYDESIALYEVPEKEEKNNNFFDNMAFYDSVAVIAGRAIVTIDPLPAEEKLPVVQQPTKTLRWQNTETGQIDNTNNNKESISRSVPIIYEMTQDTESPKTVEIKSESEPEVAPPKLETLKVENLEAAVENRRRSLKDRRLSKSLYLKIEQPKEIPIIRQQSMPKFYLDTPTERDQSTVFAAPSSALTSPMPKSSAFVYDLYSVVQMERERVQSMGKQAPVHRKESERSSRLLHYKMALRRTKSQVTQPKNPLK